MSLGADLRAVLRVAVPVMLGWEVVSAVLALALHIPHERFSPGDFLIYAATGFALARRRGVFAGPVGGAAIAAIDATLGWTISWWIGPGRPPGGFAHPAMVAVTIPIVIVIGGLLGLLGGVPGDFFRRGPPAHRS